MYVTSPLAAGGAGTALAQSRETSVTLEQRLINIPNLHIVNFADSAYCTYILTFYAYSNICILCILCIFCILRKGMIFHLDYFSFIVFIASFPIPAPSCWCTTIYSRQRRPWFYRMLRQKSPLTLFTFQRESFRSAPLKQVEAVPVWRKLELHTRLEIVHCASRRWRIDTYPPILERERHDHAKYAKYAEYAEYDLISVVLCTPPAQKQKHFRAPASQRWSLYGF